MAHEYSAARRLGKLIHIVTGVMALVANAGAAVAQSTGDASAQADGMAYESSIKCFVVDTRLSELRKRAGDATKADYYDGQSKVAFDAGVALGQKMGRSRDEIERDFSVVQVRELPELLRDEAYFRNSIATCKALGLT